MMKNKKITRKISQGMYVLTTNGGGCIVDAVSQISAGENPLISVAVMKTNYTNELMHNKDIVDISMLMEGTMPNTLNYSNFVFSNDGIIIYFSYYQVAPYSSGMFNVLINYKYL